jgi:hypothetical protein
METDKIESDYVAFEDTQTSVKTNEYIDKITLEMFMNKTNYNKYLSKTDPKKYDKIQTYKKNLRIHSIDIIDITSHLLENESEKYNTEINEAFETYVKTVIKYLDMKKIEKSNKYNDSYENDDEETMFDPNTMEGDISTLHSKPKSSFWSKERIVKGSGSNVAPYDMGLFEKK